MTRTRRRWSTIGAGDEAAAADLEVADARGVRADAERPHDLDVTAALEHARLGPQLRLGALDQRRSGSRGGSFKSSSTSRAARSPLPSRATRPGMAQITLRPITSIFSR